MKISFLSVGLVFLFSLRVAFAQPISAAESDQLRKTVKQLKQEVEQLKSQLANQSSASKNPSPSGGGLVTEDLQGKNVAPSSSTLGPLSGGANSLSPEESKEIMKQLELLQKKSKESEEFIKEIDKEL
jgi:hypothetical protein